MGQRWNIVDITPDTATNFGFVAGNTLKVTPQANIVYRLTVKAGEKMDLEVDGPDGTEGNGKRGRPLRPL